MPFEGGLNLGLDVQLHSQDVINYSCPNPDVNLANKLVKEASDVILIS